MNRYFKSIEELEEMGYTILNPANEAVVKHHIKREIDVYVTDDLRIESEAGIYLAEVSYEEPY